MYDEQSLNHTKWECKYHIVWIPKYRKKAIFEELSLSFIFVWMRRMDNETMSA
jgi:REP element-mobilizing transposase RayT